MASARRVLDTDSTAIPKDLSAVVNDGVLGLACGLYTGRWYQTTVTMPCGKKRACRHKALDTEGTAYMSSHRIRALRTELTRVP